MSFDRELAEIRFGTGLSPRLRGPRDIDEMMRRLSGPDEAAQMFDIESTEAFSKRVARMSRLLREKRKARGNRAKSQEIKKAIGKEKARARKSKEMWLWQTLRRRAFTRDGLRERLAFFWGDHFSARGKVNLMKRATSPYIESAIRPYVNRRFAEMLKAVVQEPAMLAYLDQRFSIGPDSPASADPAMQKRGAGLNENLAREVLELHTLGVRGGYSQDDVTELAELFTGLTYTAEGRFAFEPGYAQPGAERVLGKRYGGGAAKLEDVFAILEDLALRPETARHLAWKMARHFVADAPDEGLVAMMASRYSATGGHLGEMTRAMLEHPAAWMGAGNVKLPIDFVGSALRALDMPQKAIRKGKHKEIRAAFTVPMMLMGQRWQEPLGPDGWPEEDEEWITPQRLAARVDWAMSAPETLLPELPDPRDFVEVALGRRADDAVRFAARAAEDRRTGVGLILASPAFQRM